MPSATVLRLVVVCAIAFTGSTAAAQQAKDQAESRVLITIQSTNEDQRLVLKAFEQFARAVMAGEFAKAHDLLDPEIGKQLTAESVRGRYRLLEAEYGQLKRIETQVIWLGKPSPNRMASVVVVHQYESKPVQFTYGLHLGSNSWRVAGLKEGGRTPAGTVSPP